MLGKVSRDELGVVAERCVVAKCRVVGFAQRAWCCRQDWRRHRATSWVLSPSGRRRASRCRFCATSLVLSPRLASSSRDKLGVVAKRSSPSVAL